MPSQLFRWTFAGQTFSSQARQLIINVFLFYAAAELGGILPTQEDTIPQAAFATAATALGLTPKTVSKYVYLALGGALFTVAQCHRNEEDAEARKRVLKKLEEEIDRRNADGEYISLRSLASWLAEHGEPGWSFAQVHRILRDNGYVWARANNYTFLAKRADIQDRLRQHLRRKGRNRRLPSADQYIEVYIDESYLWMDSQSRYSWFKKSPSKQFLRACKTSDGRRFILMAAGTVDGWVEDTFFLGESGNNDVDYHKAIGADTFEDWFEHVLLPALHKKYPGKKFLFIIDNASFHRREFDGYGALSKMNKGQLSAFLKNYKEEVIEEEQTKQQLYERAKKIDRVLCIEEIAKQQGSEVCWLPPYHPRLNAIENMWGLTKNSVRQGFSMANRSVERMRELVQQAMQSYNSSWKKTVEKVWETEEEYCKEHSISSFEQQRVTVYIPLDDEEEEATAQQGDAQAEENQGRPENAAEDRVLAENCEPSADSSSSSSSSPPETRQHESPAQHLSSAPLRSLVHSSSSCVERNAQIQTSSSSSTSSSPPANPLQQLRDTWEMSAGTPWPFAWFFEDLTVPSAGLLPTPPATQPPPPAAQPPPPAAVPAPSSDMIPPQSRTGKGGNSKVILSGYEYLVTPSGAMVNLRRVDPPPLRTSSSAPSSQLAPAAPQKSPKPKQKRKRSVAREISAGVLLSPDPNRPALSATTKMQNRTEREKRAKLQKTQTSPAPKAARAKPKRTKAPPKSLGDVELIDQLRNEHQSSSGR